MSKVKIAVLESQVNRLLEKQKELTERVRANEKVVAAIGPLGSVVIAILGTGIFQKADAEVNDQSFTDSFRDEFSIAHMGHSFPTDQWIEKLRDHEAQKNRISIDEMLNNTLTEYEYGSDGSTESEELLQLPSDRDQSSFRW